MGLWEAGSGPTGCLFVQFADARGRQTQESTGAELASPPHSSWFMVHGPSRDQTHLPITCFAHAGRWTRSLASYGF